MMGLGICCVALRLPASAGCTIVRLGPDTGMWNSSAGGFPSLPGMSGEEKLQEGGQANPNE
jgi:hypothetical protein